MRVYYTRGQSNRYVVCKNTGQRCVQLSKRSSSFCGRAHVFLQLTAVGVNGVIARAASAIEVAQRTVLPKGIVGENARDRRLRVALIFHHV